MFATKQKLIATLASTALVAGMATQASGAPASNSKAQAGPVEVVQAHSRELNQIAARKDAAPAKAKSASSETFASPESYGVSQSTLDAIASCESGGDPTAVSPDGTYRGKYQFDYGTWASVGGSGDPAAAPEAEQDMRAAMLLSRAGTSPWPVCG